MTNRKRPATSADLPPTSTDPPPRKPRGGTRPGAGRKPNPEPPIADGELCCDPVEHFVRVMRDRRQPAARRDAAAATLFKGGWRVPIALDDELTGEDHSWMRGVAKKINVEVVADPSVDAAPPARRKPRKGT